MKEFPRKLLNLRDKNATPRRSKSVSPDHKDKVRPLSVEAIRALFKKDVTKHLLKSDIERLEPDHVKIGQVQSRLETLDVTNIADEYIKDVMLSNIGDGDVQKTVDFIVSERKAASGLIVPYNPMIRMLGAENRGNVTCYLDSLLFAMFSKLDAFECMLKTDFAIEDPRLKLVILLRVWVNLLRSGNLIRTDFDAMADCGWPDARLLEQQDTSEAFAFLTETLQLPLLSLQVDLFHQGKKDKDDHKVVYERLLNLAVPPDPEGRGLKLEDCLEEYFNARVDVLRDHEESKKGSFDDKGPGDASSFPFRNQNTIRLVRTEEGGSSSLVSSPVDLTLTPSQPCLGESPDRDIIESPGFKNTEQINLLDASSGANKLDNALSPPKRPSARHRSTSLIQRVVVDELGRPTGTEDSDMAKGAKREGSTIVKAVTIPAWQFFRLIPWHALAPTEPQSDSEVALKFDQRPVVGICLKRYAMDESGQPQRYNTFIDIPDSLRLPQFMFSGGPELDEELNGLSTEYKLVLQSAVCHRGDSLHSGHYIAFARVAPKLLTGNRRHDFDPPPDYEEAQWLKFDDLQAENRVTYVEDIKQALRSEMPYLLFYQIVPIVDMVRCSMDSREHDPPTYLESKNSIDLSHNDHSWSPFRFDPNHQRDDSQGLGAGLHSKPPSIRLSADFDKSARGSIWSTSHTGSLLSDSRRESMANTESPVVTPGANSPVLAPADEPSASRLSRAASRFTLGRQSRTPSQSGERRISFTMTRFGGLMKPSREVLAEPSLANTLQVSAATSTGSISDALVTRPNSPAEGEKPLNASPQVKDKEKQHKHRGKAKDKERADKHKGSQDEQPERQCMLI
ncbi:hypothetical protein E4U42_001400 [Claviceps africana]|uniref:ubiquitinyl hydrolase 1 n=1 Tax=Claviceps africana TaxID=83212 RepID=A0A8K0J9J0_9HYPO|nr:hypothetical protein E4U42_001400 [Claviceps africana]